MEIFRQYLKSKTSITDEQFSMLSNELKTRQVSRGEILLIANTRTKLFFFVSKGLLRSYTLDKQGKEHIIQFAVENGFIGDRNSVVFEEPAQFYVDALEDSEVVVINNKFMDLAHVVIPDFGLYNTLRLNDTIRDIQRRVSLLLAATAEERYNSFIKLYPDLGLRLSQLVIASYLGITPESLSRIRRNLVRNPERGMK
ncbi:Crp/Fnr family transcriptional regulator [Flavobacterium zepuense]|uniref:Crp/Fnr family transcriptional regulator n=1 Tax=Flavobacterium zepuense TaxID=2593302 RepID=A0A552V9K7_9FLAO|nr:Crp/Fnr family transcriptional regulator [Flavobacterium zepuense]TRW27150.1 Crp/Fnr family transcriptional regulator [Flavobacterium zepuense]